MKKQESGNYYIVETIPADVRVEELNTDPAPGKLWYCHRKGFPYCPVFGSSGTKQQAMAVCRTRNPDGRVRFT